MENINCTLDKNCYQINEDIVLAFDGYFEDPADKGNLRIDFCIYKLISGKRDFETKPVFAIKNPGGFVCESDNQGRGFFAYIKRDSLMDSFDGKITMTIGEKGNYQIDVMFDGSTEKYPDGGAKVFNMLFTVID